MKKLLITLILTVLALALFSCNTNQSNLTDTSATDTSGAADAADKEICIDASFTLIYPRGNSDMDAAYRFALLFEKATGDKLKPSLDTKTPTETDSREIVFGMTNREDLCPTDRTLFIADAFSVKAVDNRIFVSAVSDAGYEAAFSYLFYEMLGIEDINNMVKTDKAATLSRELDYFGAPQGTLEENTTNSGVRYEVTGHSRKAYNYVEFESTVVYTFDGVGESFNCFTLKYSSETAIKGVITYKNNAHAAREQA